MCTTDYIGSSVWGGAALWIIHLPGMNVLCALTISVFVLFFWSLTNWQRGEGGKERRECILEVRNKIELHRDQFLIGGDKCSAVLVTSAKEQQLLNSVVSGQDFGY